MNFKLNFPQFRREQGYRTLTGGEEEQDEQLFDFFFEGSIEEAAATAQQQNGRGSPGIGIKRN